ncbi:8-oxo-dGTP pyrophosphatase MutT (NUDIX family) [Agromyces terreus]|uniref:8-oxo-dGTP pyrophosphatase MutT (NUDIX family) n=1 Tax=Agromyces terreus TaxID=424795 RepID=A0A9X2GV68_9MICO|nr:NUDIX domain-containing protein [Agromyces terreus]MCP2369600.1 8-oxo-dGTP pyrophosphatase MutT (NUDIX family) [Agromyces terreus]
MSAELDALMDDSVDGFAATVVLLRDGERGVEVLLAERPHRGSFADAWVFPGGAVDAADASDGVLDGEAAARRAAVRETFEEVGLVVEADDLVAFSHWTPPPGSPKRLRTWFFAARVPEGELRLAPDEVVAVQWIRPIDVLERHATGGMTLWPPTWVTVHGLTRAASVDEALAELAAGEIRPYVSRYSDDRTAVLWQEDEAFDADAEHAASHAVPDDGPDARGDRHRLVMDRLPWIYVNTLGAGF